VHDNRLLPLVMGTSARRPGTRNLTRGRWCFPVCLANATRSCHVVLGIGRITERSDGSINWLRALLGIASEDLRKQRNWRETMS
jgi:hypothetical protein